MVLLTFNLEICNILFTQDQRERSGVINNFKSGKLRMLIATDVAARGLDVKDVKIVVNYDMGIGKDAVESYVHRIGRTGRAGTTGNLNSPNHPNNNPTRIMLKPRILAQE